MRAWTILSVVAMAATTVGCAGNSLEGTWENEESDNGVQDEMTLTEEGGSRDLEFSYPLYCGDVPLNPNIVIEMDVSTSGDEDSGYELEFECQSARIPAGGDCPAIDGCAAVYEILGFNFDIEVECDMNEEGDELECDYEGESITFERTGE